MRFDGVTGLAPGGSWQPSSQDGMAYCAAITPNATIASRFAAELKGVFSGSLAVPSLLTGFAIILGLLSRNHNSTPQCFNTVSVNWLNAYATAAKNVVVILLFRLG
jgi:hypothetical protein